MFEFSGADERSLRHYMMKAIDQAESAGIYVGQEVTAASLRDFYAANDETKLPEVDKLAEKYAHKTAQLMRVCQQKYGKKPKATPRKATSSSTEKTKPKQTAVKEDKKSLGDLSADELRAELARVKQELQRRGADEQSQDDEEEQLFSPVEQIASEGVHKVVIIGGGPAALSAGVYAARAGLRPVLVAPAFGGQLLGKGVDVENYPGVVGEYATGRGLVGLMRQQAKSFDARFVDSATLGIDFRQRPFNISLNGTDVQMQARTVIIATGAESRWLRVDGEQESRGKGVSACATCDGFLYRDKNVVVVGGGDHAMEDALHLARTSRSVTVLHRRDRLRASKILADRVLNHSSVKIRWNSQITSFGCGKGGDAARCRSSDEELSHVMVRATDGEKVERIDVEGAFVAIGHDPQTAFLQGQLELDADGYIALHGGTSTSVHGVFAAGDVADRTYRQAITASGTGAAAALDAERLLSQEGG